LEPLKQEKIPYSDTSLDNLFDELFPICRSITGEGLRQSLGIFERYMPLQREQVASGTAVFDWVVPQEWQINSAQLTDSAGNVVADFDKNNLHVVNYSEAVDLELPLETLRPKLHTIPHLPAAVPYVTSYYKRDWGFCISQNQLNKLEEGIYHARIDSCFVDGGVDFSHCLIDGESDKEILLSSYLCHPSMANNELSGPLVLLGLYHRVLRWPRRRYSYRFLLNPETIGSLCFLHRYNKHLSEKMTGGLVLTCLGGPDSKLTYKSSRRGDSIIDSVMAFESHNGQMNVKPFTPTSGSDERQYCSPGFNLPVGNIVRTSYGGYEGYHNSLDTKEFMTIEALVDSIDTIEQLLLKVETGSTYVNKKPYGEPHLSKYDLYPSTNSIHSWDKSDDVLEDGRTQLNLILEVLSYCDGNRSIVDLAEHLGYRLEVFHPIIELLEKNSLLEHHA